MTGNCIVFGASGELGSAICKLLAKDKIPIVGVYHKNKKVAQHLLYDSGIEEIICCDVTIDEELDKLVNKLEHKKSLDSIVISIGAWPNYISENEYHTKGNSIENINLNENVHLFKVNIFAVLNICKKLVPLLKKNEVVTNIIIIGSLNGQKLIPSPVHFAASKSALKGATETLAKELGKHNICVNLICPGLLESSHLKIIDKNLQDSYLKHTVSGRFARPEEIAEVVNWFVGENTYISGQSIILDGGL